MFTTAELRPVQRWTNNSAQYSLWLLERPQFSFPLPSSPHTLGDTKLTGTYYSRTPFGVPSREEWRNLWAAWDFVTTRMIPPSMLFEKPIELRHTCLFYLGHIPTFLDVQLSKLLQEPSTEPEIFTVSFLFFFCFLQVESSSHSINYSAFLRFVPKSCVHGRRQL
jgi:L-histidine Nalpha-methyltransferase / hercynylcysteine S-oxide synthase